MVDAAGGAKLRLVSDDRDDLERRVDRLDWQLRVLLAERRAMRRHSDELRPAVAALRVGIARLWAGIVRRHGDLDRQRRRGTGA